MVSNLGSDTSRGMSNKLRVGVLVESNFIPKWAFKMLERINGSNYSEMILIVRNDKSTKIQKSIFKKIKDKLPYLLYAAFIRVANKTKKLEPNAFDLLDILKLFPNVPNISVVPIQKKFSDFFSKDDINKIKSSNVDVFIRLGFRILRGDILTCAKYGIWSYHHGDNRKNRGAPPGFWEVLEMWPETGSILQILTESLDEGIVLSRSYSQTDPRYHLIYFLNNKNSYYWKTLSFLPRKLEELYILGEEEFLTRIRKENQHPFFYSNRLYTTPRNAEFIASAFKHYLIYIWRKLPSLLYTNKWILLYRLIPNKEFSTSFWRFKKLIPPKDRYWADPFVVYEKDKHFVFIEEFMYESRKAHISYLTLDKDGNWSTPRKIIDESYHLSYPFIFSHKNEYYMIPESASNRTIDLYKCVKFPDEWEHAQTLMKDIYAVDATLLYKDGIWWLFANIIKNEGASSLDELFLFYSSDLFSQNWIPHPKNPVVSDVKSSRPAGKIFSYNENLYRPSQNNCYRYGYGMKINQIITLTRDDYKEICVNNIEPMWDKMIKGVHTLNFSKGLTMIDGLMKKTKYF